LRALADLLTPWLVSIAELAALVAGGLVLHSVVYAVARRVAARTRYDFDGFFVARTRAPARLLMPLVLLALAWPDLGLPADSAPAQLERFLLQLLQRADAGALARAPAPEALHRGMPGLAALGLGMRRSAAAPACTVTVPALQSTSASPTCWWKAAGAFACARAANSRPRTGVNRATPIRWSPAAWTRYRRPHG